jgi:membrane fusion protein, heavy metal efflux system
MNMTNRLLSALTIVAALLAGACGKSDEAPAPQAEQAPAKGEHGEAGHKEGAEAAGSHEGEGGAEGPEGVELSAEQIKTAGIVLAQAGPTKVREVLPLYGVVAPNAERVREVAARFPGVIRTVQRKIGDTVRQGDTLATVESNESLQTYAVAAPQAGVITARNANPGEQTGDKTLFTVADLSTVWVELSLFPRDVAKVRVGQKARVRSADAGLAAEGRIVYVAPLGSSASQTLTARVLVDNNDRRWAPGLYVNAEVILAEGEVPLAVRSEALQSLEDKTVVFVQGEHGFEPRPVRVGRSDGEVSEVLEGLAAGETYAAANSFIIKAELGKGSAEHGH